ncbi:putative ATP-dependent RNA helicase DHX57 [Drosophila elegans]|uniref:putative ATP-dependent RNA helicase DHX57 n=1 Tax=Drosophila elegans TaxID=30023 RepID=UPI0007E70945|nr:putative ATP-dependent RNA helicase DHX57 [Drosophila elegans]
MDEFSRQQMDDCFLRSPSDIRTTNVQAVPKSQASDNKSRKTELHVLRLNDESRQMTMDTLRQIHGPDFQLDDISKYKDRGRGGHGVKHSYWQDRGTLMVQSVQGVRSSASGNSDSDADRLRRYALAKLENYGFQAVHCLEAYEHCAGDTEAALLLLYRRYMRIPDEEEEKEKEEQLTLEPPSEQELLDMRAEEKEALESIYDQGTYEEREANSVWNLKFRIDHLLAHSPSEVRKAREAVLAAAAAAAQAALDKKKKAPQRCRNFDRDGTCKFGPKCRFAHLPPLPTETDTPKKDTVDENDNELWFHVEVRFPPGSRYPYEAPFIYLKTTCHDIPHELRLRYARHLYREARAICRDGIPCVYSICDLLQSNEQLAGRLDTSAFPSPKHSIFHDEPEGGGADRDADHQQAPKPSHYARGQTARNEGGRQRNAEAQARENRRLLQQFVERRKEERYQKVIDGRKQLPAFAEIERILALIERSPVVVISGETGCGKSTQVPQFILDNWFFRALQLPAKEQLPHVEIICTQPRRLSAIGVAERVAAERLDRIGQLVGYQIRLENKVSQSTRLSFCTTGILLRRLASDPLLEGVTHVIVDEVHERSEESDFLLLILKNLLRERKDLKVILMSATLNAALFSDYFGGAPVLDIPGRTYPVQQFFLEDILEMSDFVMEYDTKYCRKLKKHEQDVLERELEYADVQASGQAPGKNIKDEKLTLAETYQRYAEYSKPTCKSIYLMEPMTINPELIESVLKYIVEGAHDWPREGTILIFLPGFGEIQTVHDSLLDHALFSPRAGKFVLVPLHSALSGEDQALVFKKAPPGKRKIVLSTNIAETSVTIDDCVFVVDCGLMKEKCFDSNRNMESLDLVWVSRANAKQRKGRAGRVMPGVCIHLYTSHRYHQHILAQPVPEIQRVPLEQIVLRIKTLQTFASRNTLSVLLETLEAPTEDSVLGALTRLRDVGALDAEDQLTPLGHHLAALPVDVRIGKLMLYGAIFQCLDSVLTIAACLSNKSPFVSPLSKRTEADKCKRMFALGNSDHLTVLNAYRKWLDVARRGNYAASRNYATEHFLSLNTLETIADLKYQYLELLVSIGFVPINVPRRRKNACDNILTLTGVDQNHNGDNNRLLTSLLCAALYPNIVKIMTPERVYVQTAGGAVPREPSHQDLRFKTRGDGYVKIHPSSVNSQVAVFQAPFLVYQEKVRTSAIYIRDCSMLPLIAMVLFAGSDFKVELHDGDFLFLLESGWIILKAHDLETAEMVQCLRAEMIKLLEEKIRDPCLNLLHHKNGCRMIANIVHLISKNS